LKEKIRMDLVALGIVFSLIVLFVFVALPTLFYDYAEATYLVVSAILCIEILELMILIYMLTRRSGSPV
jgi:hypothetical protein